MAKRISVGDSVYVFTGNDGKKTNDLIISSHGGYISRPEMGKQTGTARNIPGLGGFIKVPPPTTIYFYGPHKMSLLDPGLTPFGGSRLNYLEECKPNDRPIRNYRLTKYQEDGGAESYKDVSDFVDRNRLDGKLLQENIGEMNEIKDQWEEGFIGLDGLEMYEMLKQACANPNTQFDVLTVHPSGIRSMLGITLSDVLTDLRAAGLTYNNIHCCFCRSRVPFDTGAHDAKRNPIPK